VGKRGMVARGKGFPGWIEKCGKVRAAERMEKNGGPSAQARARPAAGHCRYTACGFAAPTSGGRSEMDAVAEADVEQLSRLAADSVIAAKVQGLQIGQVRRRCQRLRPDVRQVHPRVTQPRESCEVWRVRQRDRPRVAGPDACER